MAISELTIPCPIDGLAVFAVDLDWKRNEAEDRDSHMHIDVASTAAQCSNGHLWRLSGEILVERRGG